MKNKRHDILFLALGVILTLPLYAFADTSVSAGFPQGPVWFSKSAPVHGETIKLFTALYNAGKAKIRGDVVFTVDGSAVGTASFELPEGESKIVSVPWTASTGAHFVKARVENASDTSLRQEVSLGNAATGETLLEVAPAPPKPILVQALADASDAISNTTQVLLPVVASAAGGIFKETEELRKSAVVALENSLSGGSERPASAESEETAAGTYRTPENALLASLHIAPASTGLMRMLQQGLLFLVSYVWIFYPLLILLLLGILYALGKALSQKHSLKKT